MKYFISIFLLLHFSDASSQFYESKQNISCGKLLRFDLFPSTYVPARTIEVWLPPEYDSLSDYNVMYIQDGQMLFDSTTTWNKTEWGLDEMLCNNQEVLNLGQCIIVAIHNIPHLRRAEYFPQNAIPYIPMDVLKTYQDTFVRADWNANHYLKFIVKELKPYIEKKFLINTSKSNHYIGGSSMGGLISWYAVCEYPEVFKGAICLSTHWVCSFKPFVQHFNYFSDAFVRYLQTRVHALRGNYFYFDYGTLGLDADYEKHQQKIDRVLTAFPEGVVFKTKKCFNEDHTERSWAKRVPDAVVYLLSN